MAKFFHSTRSSLFSTGLGADRNVESRHFLSFSFPSNAQLDDKSALNEWLERMIFLYDDLKWLLAQPVNVFWNQVIFDASWNICLDSFLFNSPRNHDLKNVPENCKVALSRVSKLFLLAMKRMSLCDEDPAMCFTSTELGNLIYENYLFDAAKLLDMCSIFYRPGNSVVGILEEIVGDIFRMQPKYFDDITNAVQSMIITITNIEEKLAISESLNASKHAKGNSVNGREAQDMMLFIYDMVNTFKSFHHVFPDICKVFFKVDVIGRLVTICENMLSCILNLIEVNRKRYKYIQKEIISSSLQLIDMIIENGYAKKIQSADVNKEELTDEFINIMDTIAQHPNFLSSYCKLGTIPKVFGIIEALGCIDMSSLQYIRSMVSSSVSENDSNQILHQLHVLLPMKGEDYLNKCIEKYGPQVDVIVNNVMEGNMPEETKSKVNTKKEISVPNKDVLEDKEHVALLKSTLLSATYEYNDDDDRYNMYDDEYDDTYDSQNVAAADADSAEELKDMTSRRKFTIPDALRQIGDVSSEDEDGEEGSKNNINPKNRGLIQKQNKGNLKSGGRNRGNQRVSSGVGGGGGGGKGRGGGGSKGQRENPSVKKNDGDRSGVNQGGSDAGTDVNNRDGGRGENLGVKRNDGDQSGSNQGRKDAGTNVNNRGRGRGKGNKHNRRQLADKKKAKGMMPF